MKNRTDVFASRAFRVCLMSCAVFAAVAVPAAPADGQGRTGPTQEARASDPPILERDVSRILGGVPMTAADDMHQRVVRLLDFDSYKELVRGLTSRTRSGKITKLAVRDVIHGREVKNVEALANPEALEFFRDLEALA